MYGRTFLESAASEKGASGRFDREQRQPLPLRRRPLALKTGGDIRVRSRGYLTVLDSRELACRASALRRSHGCSRIVGRRMVHGEP